MLYSSSLDELKRSDVAGTLPPAMGTGGLFPPAAAIEIVKVATFESRLPSFARNVNVSLPLAPALAV